ncbi:hypothetical protein FEM03_11560 [Phragmitibacter flavus]|uniref:Uncharacterized protein n=1 Tax=Phragmitibacter flavus TaxID=2576071 RepID=A0A5R8KEG4_9BACT|nr:hypothetical protein [Phragmitibacter flavus]TLD70365.1 hypothetical protein FEM03_11560 [Phragmitibacter flavus]
MTHRLLAFMLACVIGVPMCWCCDARAEAAVVEAEEVLCCHAAANADEGASAPVSSSSSDSEKECPCEDSLRARDKVAHEVLAPLGGWVLAVVESWKFGDDEWVNSSRPSAEYSRETRVRPDGERPIYQRHCRMLI